MRAHPFVQLQFGNIERVYIVIYVVFVRHGAYTSDLLEGLQEVREVEAHECATARRALFSFGETLYEGVRDYMRYVFP